jgi:hypothetical protein
VSREPERHRRVVPEDEIAHAVIGHQAFDEALLRGVARDLTRQTFRQARHGHTHAAAALTNFEAERAFVEDRLFDEKDAPSRGAAAHEVLRSLVDEVPTQV